MADDECCLRTDFDKNAEKYHITRCLKGLSKSGMWWVRGIERFFTEVLKICINPLLLKDMEKAAESLHGKYWRGKGFVS